MHTAECVLGEHTHDADAHGHVHGYVDPSILRSRRGLSAVGTSLAVLAVTTVAQAVLYLASGSVALLAELIHNGSDALTALPIGVAFLLRSKAGERWAGMAVVATVFVSALIAGAVAIDRLVHPQTPGHLLGLALAGVVGIVGNGIAARVRSRAGRDLGSPALSADGAHARADAYVSVGVVVSAALVAGGIRIADPLIALVVTVIILRITAHAWLTVRHPHTH